MTGSRNRPGSPEGFYDYSLIEIAGKLTCSQPVGIHRQEKPNNEHQKNRTKTAQSVVPDPDDRICAGRECCAVASGSTSIPRRGPLE